MSAIKRLLFTAFASKFALVVFRVAGNLVSVECVKGYHLVAHGTRNPDMDVVVSVQPPES
jgi:hypothetical protein